MKTIKTLIFLIVLAAAALVGYAWSGVYDVAAGTGHTPVVAWYLEFLRENSIERRAEQLQVPGDLDSTTRVAAGASHYRDMCAICHGHPGQEPAKTFDPAPPALALHAVEPDEAFWVIKNGIKMTAMPQHRNHSDDDIWDIVAFLQLMPKLSPSEYEAMTAAAPPHEHDEDDQLDEDDMDVEPEGDSGQ